jgi:heme A synthase
VRAAADNLILLVLLQAGLGVLVVVTMVWLSLAALHQISALVLFAAALHFLYVLAPGEPLRVTSPTA